MNWTSHAFNKVERYVLKCVVISAVCFCIVLVGFVFCLSVILVGGYDGGGGGDTGKNCVWPLVLAP